MNDKLLSVSDVAERLNTTPGMVRQLRIQGRLPPAIEGLGRRVRWRESDFNKWLASLPATK